MYSCWQWRVGSEQNCLHSFNSEVMIVFVCYTSAVVTPPQVCVYRVVVMNRLFNVVVTPPTPTPYCASVKQVQSGILSSTQAVSVRPEN